MKRNNKFICLLSAISLLGGLVGCGEGGNGNGITVTFWHTFGQSIVDELAKKVSSFETAVKSQEGIDVHVELSYQGDYTAIKDKVTKGFATGNLPNISIAYPDHVAEYLSFEETDGEYIENLDTYIADPEIGIGKEAYLNDDKGTDDFVTSFYEEGKQYAKEGTYSLPLMKSTEVMFYNEDDVLKAMEFYKSESEINTRTKLKAFMKSISWDDFIELCNVINTNKSSISSTLKTPCIYDSDSNLFISKMYQKSIPFISNSEGKGKLDFSEGKALDNAKALVTDLKKNKDDGILLTKGTNGGTYGSDSFKNGLCSFTVGSSGGTGYNSPTGGSFNVGVCRVPASEDNPLYVSQGPTMTLLHSNNAENSKYAWKFMKYITNSQNNVDLCINGSQGYVPVRESSYITDDYKQYLAEGEIYAASAKVVNEDINGKYLLTPVFKGSAVVREQVGGLITSALSGTKSIDEAFKYAIQQCKLSM